MTTPTTIIAIGGNPGSGKTSLVKSIIFEKLANDPWSHNIKDTEFKLLSYSHNPNKNLFILGKYDQTNTFSGTDLLSMAVQPSVKQWITSSAAAKGSTIIFEGDRLFNDSFLSFLYSSLKVNFHIFYLNVPQDILQLRYSLRGSHQNPSFLKGRITKYNNIINNKSHPYHHLIQIVENNSLEQQQDLVTKILHLIN